MTPAQRELHAKALCIQCGTPLKSAKAFECNQCGGGKANFAMAGKFFGAGRASMGQEFKRRIGHSSGAPGAPIQPKEDE